MESEKVKEIKKGLECCTNPVYCEKECPYHIYERHLECINELAKDSLTLINELESELKELNNELKRYKMDWLNSEKMHLQADMEDTEFELFCANKSLEEVRAENQQLKDRIADLENIGLNEEMTVGEYLRELERLKKDNELLRNAKVVYENVDYCYEDLKKAQDRIAELEKENERFANSITCQVVLPDEKFEELKKNAFEDFNLTKIMLKQFAERLKEHPIIKIYSLHNACERIPKAIDEILKEFVNKGESDK